jgi:uncharacterized sulfatase
VPRPNIVLIMTDTQGADCVGADRGDRRLMTPCIDALAAQGAWCERAYTTSPLCTPARSGLFTGILSQRSGAWTNSLALAGNVSHLGQRFRDLGYRTAYMGKWHLDGHDYFGAGRCPDGWEAAHWYDGRNYLEELSPAERRFWRREVTYESLKRTGIGADFTWAGRCVRRAGRFLESCASGDQPFLLVVSFDEPHHPFACPAADVEPFLDQRFDIGPSATDDLADKPAHYRSWQGGAQRRREHHLPLYYGCNRFVDRCIGEVVAQVDALARGETVVVYTSDHGDMRGAHGLHSKGPAPFEEITRIPLIVRGAGIPAGRRVRTPVSHADVLPTLLGLAGAEAPPALDGSDIAPLLRGAERPEREVMVEYHRYELSHDGFGGYAPMRCLVGSEWKLALHEHSGDELYHLAGDRHELRNLIADPDRATVRDAMHDRLLAWMDERRDPWRGESWHSRPWRRRDHRSWKLPSRPNPPDGLAPDYLDYDTGEATRGTHREGEF